MGAANSTILVLAPGFGIILQNNGMRYDFCELLGGFFDSFLMILIQLLLIFHHLRGQLEGRSKEFPVVSEGGQNGPIYHAFTMHHSYAYFFFKGLKSTEVSLLKYSL
jgi:hypothetical protein